ncbi:MAG: DUF1513 domain-containing protein, partial [Psychrobacter urativorans]
MSITKANTAALATESSSKLQTPKNNRASALSSHELLTASASTTLATVMGTAALVGIHHRYRKQRQPDASLQDYVIGIRSQWYLLSSAPRTQLTRFRYASRQAASAWQQAYHNSIKDSDNDNSTTDFSGAHTTTVLPRPVCWVSGVASMPKNIALADDSSDENGFGVVGIDAD